MMKIWYILAKEVKSFFYAPLGMLLVPAYLGLCGSYFNTSLTNYMMLIHPANPDMVVTGGVIVTTNLLVPFFESLYNILVLIVPIITMRSFAEEKKLGNYELMMSYPLKPWQIILGKYLGSLAISYLLLVLSFIYPLLTAWKGLPYWPQVYAAYLGLFLFVTLYVAIGVIASLITENQIIAAMITFAAYFGTVVLKYLAFILPAPFDVMMQNFLFDAHVHYFLDGLVYLGDVVMYLGTTAIILLLGYYNLGKHFQRR